MLCQVLRSCLGAAMGVALTAASVSAVTVTHIVGANSPDGRAFLLKRFTLPTTTTVVGLEFLSNDVQTVFPRVLLLEGPVEKLRTQTWVRSFENVGPAPGLHRVRLALEPTAMRGGTEVYAAVQLPANSGLHGAGSGPGVGGVKRQGVSTSFLAMEDGVLAAIDVDLAIELVLEGGQRIGSIASRATKPNAGPKDETDRVLATYLDSGSPNPFGTQATIQFGLERQVPVELAVYNVAGRRVRTLMKGMLVRGVHVGKWDGNDEYGNAVASGVYIVRLSTPEKSLTRKLILAR